MLRSLKKQIQTMLFVALLMLCPLLNYTASAEPIHDKIYQALLNLQPTVDVSEFGIDPTDAMKKYFDVLDMHPDIFYTGRTIQTNYQYDADNKPINIVLSFKYLYNTDDILYKRQYLDDRVNYIASTVNPDLSDFEKILFVHDYVVNNVRYNSETLEKGKFYPEDSTAYGALIGGRAICSGYATSIKLLLNKLGIECGIIDSPDMNHAWNYVYLNGKYYHLDATWDDPVYYGSDILTYRCFLLDDQTMSSDHKWDKTKYPKCTSDTFTFMKGFNSFNSKRDGLIINYTNSFGDKSIVDLSVYAIKNLNQLNSLVNNALTFKTFYYYNVAYTEIIKLGDIYTRDSLLAKLGTIANTIWTNDVRHVNSLLDTIASTGNGRTYDEAVIFITNSNLPQIDKEYFLGEVTSWGKRLVWTPEYKTAMAALINAATEKTPLSIQTAKDKISLIINSLSRDYLLEELDSIKINPETIDTTKVE
jgi:hypothetical protein